MPDACELYYVNRDTLFSYHKVSEMFLQRLMSLYVASHYKNTPNDLQMLSDAPAHHIFCLLGPLSNEAMALSGLPEILCVVQVCLEGEISHQSVVDNLQRGKRASGDLIPWTVSQQFQDNDFPRLAGGRIVRIATHPDYQGMGYGQRAMKLLQEYYEGKIVNLDENESKSRRKLDVDKNEIEVVADEVRNRTHDYHPTRIIKEKSKFRNVFITIPIGKFDFLRGWYCFIIFFLRINLGTVVIKTLR